MNVVDSCGWIEYFTGSHRAGSYEPAIHDTRRLIVPTICLFEVFRSFLRQHKETEAREAIGAMRNETTIVGINESTAVHAARLSVQYGLSMADSLVFAIARDHHATLWTNDPSFKNIKGVKYIK